MVERVDRGVGVRARARRTGGFPFVVCDRGRLACKLVGVRIAERPGVVVAGARHVEREAREIVGRRVGIAHRG